MLKSLWSKLRGENQGQYRTVGDNQDENSIQPVESEKPSVKSMPELGSIKQESFPWRRLIPFYFAVIADSVALTSISPFIFGNWPQKIKFQRYVQKKIWYD
jgi:hypothetical protein